MRESPSNFVDRLDEKNRGLIAELNNSSFCRAFFAPDAPSPIVEALIGNLLQEVGGYGGHLTIAISTSLGRLANHPQWLPWLRPLMEALLGEVAHPEMARQDSSALGSRTDDAAADHLASPACFAVGAIARSLSQEQHPLTHLGYFYLLEGTTSEMAPRMQAVLEAHRIDSPFVRLHSKEDAEHSANLRRIITEIVAEDPAAAVQIEYGYDCFAMAYPMLVWNAAADRALAQQQ